jgi:hypothetical protein
MIEPALEHEAIAALDRALRQTDPLSRMVMIERALRLHRRAVEAAENNSAAESRPADGARRAPH